jgi:hypothetical protein
VIKDFGGWINDFSFDMGCVIDKQEACVVWIGVRFCYSLDDILYMRLKHLIGTALERI